MITLFVSLHYSSNLQSNQLNGAIPSDIGRLTLMTWMSVHNIYTVYDVLCSAALNRGFVDRRLDNNPLNGTVPSEIGRMTALVLL